MHDCWPESADGTCTHVARQFIRLDKFDFVLVCVRVGRGAKPSNNRPGPSLVLFFHHLSVSSVRRRRVASRSQFSTKLIYRPNGAYYLSFVRCGCRRIVVAVAVSVLFVLASCRVYTFHPSLGLRREYSLCFVSAHTNDLIEFK